MGTYTREKQSIKSMAAFFEIPGSTCPVGVARMMLKAFLSDLQSLFALKADNKVTYLRILMLVLLIVAFGGHSAYGFVIKFIIVSINL